MNILVIHGPNLNLLGMREPGIYGTSTLQQVNEMVRAKAGQVGAEVRIVQHSSEGDIIDVIHSSIGWADGIVINPAAYTHYSIAIRAAIAAARIATVEVHLSNIFAREEFRHKSVVSGVSLGVVSGLGPMGYVYALDYLAQDYLARRHQG